MPLAMVWARDVRVTALADNLQLVSIPMEAAHQADGTGLTEAETAVTFLAACGLSNLSIARRRGTSVRTIANQLAAAYLKLGVSGRRGLRASLHRTGGTHVDEGRPPRAR